MPNNREPARTNQQHFRPTCCASCPDPRSGAVGDRDDDGDHGKVLKKRARDDSDWKNGPEILGNAHRKVDKSSSCSSLCSMTL